ncbi:MAG TPA: DUF1194 domain-containing protein [Dongiaceae bacterium]|jgi:hypothetical protein|nr:DUF1194 domain-containing protein [Dongiaceae bacterium]
MNRVMEAMVLALGCALLDARVAAADVIRTDVNVVTAVDISDSVEPRQIALQIDGMAQALRTYAILEAIQEGQHGSIGFAVFAWYHGHHYPELVSWTLIASASDAISVSDQLLKSLRLAREAEGRRQSKIHHLGRLTDMSEAIGHAAELLRMAPYAASRSVVNIISNGEDNLGEGPRLARDTLIAQGGTINGVILGGEPRIVDYFRQEVIGGPNAFLLPADDADSIVRLFVRKLRSDIVSYIGPARIRTTFEKTHETQLTQLEAERLPQAAQYAALPGQHAARRTEIPDD